MFNFDDLNEKLKSLIIDYEEVPDSLQLQLSEIKEIIMKSREQEKGDQEFYLLDAGYRIGFTQGQRAERFKIVNCDVLTKYLALDDNRKGYIRGHVQHFLTDARSFERMFSCLPPTTQGYIAEDVKKQYAAQQAELERKTKK